MIEYCHAYIASGGPLSRLEDDLSGLGKSLGFKSEVFATPTGVFVTAIDAAGKPHSTIARIRQGGVNLEKLCWLESIMQDIRSGKINLETANRILNSRHFRKQAYTSLQMFIAAFVAGFAISFPAYGRIVGAIGSGLIAALVWWVTNPGLSTRIQSAIFREFIGCMFALSGAFALQQLYASPFDAYSIGGIVMLLPGLTLTSAIAELAEQNLISGTAKFMQAVLTLLALGLAFLLFSDLTVALKLPDIVLDTPRIQLNALVSSLFMFISMVGFGVIFKVPRKSLPWAALTGVLGWVTFGFVSDPNYMAAAPFVAAFVVGFLALALSKAFKVPSQVFSVPGIISLLPGMIALTSFQSFALGKETRGIELAFHVALVSGSITFGLLCARIPFLNTRRNT